MGLIVGVDASRNRSGGAIAHLAGILGELDPARWGIRQIHLWAYRALHDVLPDRPWLAKHAPPQLEASLASQLAWQRFHLKDELRSKRCNILYTTDASSLCNFSPSVVFSQDLLSYERHVLREMSLGYGWLRVLAILRVQNAAFRRADGVIFLTKHAARIIQQSCGRLEQTACIPHGVDPSFREARTMAAWPVRGEGPIRCVYVSPVLSYKHQWNAVEAVEILRRRGHDVTLTLVGTGTGKAWERLEQQVQRSDPLGEYVTLSGHVPHSELADRIAEAHVYFFLSSCEAFGITLLEGMAMGLPIVASGESSLPETLQDGGVYCNPRDSVSVADATERLIADPQLRAQLSARARELSERYSWERCASETFDFIATTVHNEMGKK